jgi:hypothetical protein
MLPFSCLFIEHVTIFLKIYNQQINANIQTVEKHSKKFFYNKKVPKIDFK